MEQQTTTAGPGVQIPPMAPESTPNLPAPAPKKSPMVAGAPVMSIVPSSLDECFRLAKGIAMAGWAPKSYKSKDERGGEFFDENKIALGIMHGLELGITPIAALQTIAVINGTPAVYGDGMLALVQRSGWMSDYAEQRTVDPTGKFASYTVTATRKGTPTPYSATFTMDMARNAGLTSKTGPWKDYPERMCLWRARAWALRAGFADVLKGLQSAEELLDYIDVTPTPTPTPPAKKDAKSALDGFAAAVQSVHEPAKTPASEPASAAETQAPAAAENAESGVLRATEIGTPLAPTEVLDDFRSSGKWMPAWKWISETLPGLNQEQAAEIAQMYGDILTAVSGHNTKYQKAVKDLLDSKGITLNGNNA